MHSWWHATFQLGTNYFCVSEKNTPLKQKNYFYSVFYAQVSYVYKNRLANKRVTSKSEKKKMNPKKVPIWKKLKPPKNADWDQIWHRNSQKNTCFCSAKRPQIPTSFRKVGLSQSKDRPRREGMVEKSLPLKPIALKGGIAFYIVLRFGVSRMDGDPFRA